jgi:dTDP-4-dehydrorhamnose reductase
MHQPTRNETRSVLLVVGADGLIGRALTDNWAGKVVFETTHLPDTLSDHRIFLDMEQDVSGWHPPESVFVAIICAAISSLERCRTQPEQSAWFNVHNTVAVAKKLLTKGAFVIFISSNLVYDGSIPFRRAEDLVCPQTEYGRQKAETERQLLVLGDSVSVVRFTKVLSPDMPLLRRWLLALQNGETIHPFSDMVMSPVSLSFVVDVLRRVAELHLPGIVQVSAKEDLTYAQVAQYIARRIGANLDLVQPIRSTQSGLQIEAVPAHTTLDTTRLRREFGIEPPDVWSTIDLVFGL